MPLSPSTRFWAAWYLLACRVYRAGSKGPLLFFLHGGGYTGMSWAACVRHLDTAK